MAHNVFLIPYEQALALSRRAPFSFTPKFLERAKVFGRKCLDEMVL